ncbi:MAG: hypothetical protein M4579_003349 [Chaenotheca gracillima]|nr:MAG: hypothetical protein M4579_003349 [Chaenotheca gracillima]
MGGDQLSGDQKPPENVAGYLIMDSVDSYHPDQPSNHCRLPTPHPSARNYSKGEPSCELYRATLQQSPPVSPSPSKISDLRGSSSRSRSSSYWENQDGNPVFLEEVERHYESRANASSGILSPRTPVTAERLTPSTPSLRMGSLQENKGPDEACSPVSKRFTLFESNKLRDEICRLKQLIKQDVACQLCSANFEYSPDREKTIKEHYLAEHVSTCDKRCPYCYNPAWDGWDVREKRGHLMQHHSNTLDKSFRQPRNDGTGAEPQSADEGLDNPTIMSRPLPERWPNLPLTQRAKASSSSGTLPALQESESPEKVEREALSSSGNGSTPAVTGSNRVSPSSPGKRSREIDVEVNEPPNPRRKRPRVVRSLLQATAASQRPKRLMSVRLEDLDFAYKTSKEDDDSESTVVPNKAQPKKKRSKNVTDPTFRAPLTPSDSRAEEKSFAP